MQHSQWYTCASCTATTSGRSSPSSGPRASTRAPSSSTGSPRATTGCARSPSTPATRSTRRRARRSTSWRRPTGCPRPRSHRGRQQGAASGGGQALRRLGDVQRAARRSTRTRRSSSTARCATDAPPMPTGKKLCRLQAALPDRLDRLPGQPRRVREGVERASWGSEAPRRPGRSRARARPAGRARGSSAWLVGGAAAVLVLYPIVFLLQASLSVGDPQARPPEAYGLDNFAGLGRYGHIFAQHAARRRWPRP